MPMLDELWEVGVCLTRWIDNIGLVQVDVLILFLIISKHQVNSQKCSQFTMSIDY